ncbi:hypothetical protein DL98DRAFT_438235, partial [Cadophora sp. DSE1049]
KDNTLVLSMSTYSNTEGKVKRLHRRPSETSTSAKTACVPFGTYTRAWFKILKYENDYNYQIGTINRSNQLKKPNFLQRICLISG